MRTAVLSALLLVGLAHPLCWGASAWNGFATPSATSYIIPIGPVANAAVGDLNGDGYPDEVVSQASYLQVLLNQSGVLSAGAKYTVGTVSRVVLGDINRDGRLDVVAVGSLTAVLLGKGDGTFQSPKLISGTGTDAALGDVNGDGYPDLVVVTAAGLQVRTNDQHGSFGTPSYLPFLQSTPVTAAVVDINGDGFLDVVCANGSLVVLLGNGDGTVRDPIVSAVNATNFAVADANRDGVPDIYYTGVVAGVSSAGVLLGNRDGTFRQVTATAVGPSAQELALGDFDGDGVLDMAVSSFGDGVASSTAASGMTVLLGNPDGTFRGGNQYAFSGAGNPAVDMNGDGKLDLVIGGTAIAFGNGDGTFKAAQQIGVGAVNHLSWTAFEVDGVPEFAYVGASDQVSTLSRVAGTWSRSKVEGLAGTQVTSGDFDDDGIADLATASTNTVSITRGGGNGGFQSVQQTSLPTSGTHFLASGRLDQDRYDDVVTASGSTVEILIGRGDGYFAPSAAVTLLYGDAGGVLVRDIDGDGIGDIVALHDYGLTILLGDSSGRYETQQYFSAAGKIGGAAVQDINGDGRPDLVYSAPLLNKVYVLWGNGDGTFAPGATYTVQSPRDVLIADIDGDTYPDLLVCSDYGGLATLLGTAQRTFSAVAYWYSNTGQLQPALAEINGDAIPDIVTFDSMGAITFFQNQGLVHAPSPAIGSSVTGLDFGSFILGSSPKVESLKLSNAGNLVLPLRITASGDFTEWDTCGRSLAVGAACFAFVSFHPRGIGVRTAYLSIQAGAVRESISLSATVLNATAQWTRPNRGSRGQVSPQAGPVVGVTKTMFATVLPAPQPAASAPSVPRGRPVLRPTPRRDGLTGVCVLSSQHPLEKGESMWLVAQGCASTYIQNLYPVEAWPSAAGGNNETASNSHMEGRTESGRGKHFDGKRSFRSGDLHRRNHRGGRPLHQPVGNPGGGGSGVRFDDGGERTGEGRHHPGVY
jgi:hypothetical protein